MDTPQSEISRFLPIGRLEPAPIAGKAMERKPCLVASSRAFRTHIRTDFSLDRHRWLMPAT